MNTRMTHRARLGAVLAVAALAVAATLAGATRAETAALADGPYVVIVNAGNGYGEPGDAAKKVVKQLFLKERTDWPGGAEAKPFDRPADSPEHTAFRDKVLEMTAAELAQHWIDQKQKTGATPPREVSSASMMIKFVAKSEGAFGVVAKSEAEGADGVKVLFEIGG